MRWTLLLGLLACDGAGGEAPNRGAPAEPVACAAEEAALPTSWETTARPFFLNYCGACHAAASPQRFGAPLAATFDTEAEVQRWASRIRVRVLEQGDMPQGGGVPAEDLLLLEAWLDCSGY